LAKLQIGAEASAAKCHFKSGGRVFAQHLLALNAVGVGCDLSRKIAFRIIRAANEGAEASGFQRKLSVVALRAFTRGPAVHAFGKNMRLEQIIERVEPDAIAHFLDFVDGSDKLLPDLGKHGSPVDRARRNLVELLFESSREIVFDVAGKEAFEERN